MLYSLTNQHNESLYTTSLPDGVIHLPDLMTSAFLPSLQGPQGCLSDDHPNYFLPNARQTARRRPELRLAPYHSSVLHHPEGEMEKKKENNITDIYKNSNNKWNLIYSFHFLYLIIHEYT